jgi:hypothetical protein
MSTPSSRAGSCRRRPPRAGLYQGRVSAHRYQNQNAMETTCHIQTRICELAPVHARRSRGFSIWSFENIGTALYWAVRVPVAQ